jgi:hydrogenase nickel incorporation protein HypA/HybF
MHELSIALSILDVANEEAERRGGVRVDAIHLRLGPLSGVVKEALLSAYEIAIADSPVNAARLVIEDMPLSGRCPACAQTRRLVSVQELCCVECGTPTPEIVSGRELEVVGLEIQE